MGFCPIDGAFNTLPRDLPEGLQVIRHVAAAVRFPANLRALSRQGALVAWQSPVDMEHLGG